MSNRETFAEIAARNRVDFTDIDGGTTRFAGRMEPFLTPLRDKATSILEIGVRGGTSLRVWRDFFPNAQVHGIDIDPKCVEQEEERVSIHIGDQGDREFLTKIGESFGPFDLIVDDGSHETEHQLFSFHTLWPYLVSEGIYIIEDTATAYDGFEPHPFGLLTNVKSWLDSAQLRGGSIRGYRDDARVIARCRDIQQSERTGKPRKLSMFDEEVFGVYVSMSLVIVQKARYMSDEEFEERKSRMFPTGVIT